MNVVWAPLASPLAPSCICLAFASAIQFIDFLTGEYFLDEFGEFPNPTMFPRPLNIALSKSIEEKIELRLVEAQAEAKANGGKCQRRRFDAKTDPLGAEIT